MLILKNYLGNLSNNQKNMKRIICFLICFVAFLSIVKSELINNEDEIYFIDRGVIIPPPIKSWLHIHRIERSGENSCNVIDDIEYSTGNAFIDKLIYPALYAMFAMRKPIYKRELS